jgi:glutathionyl-hydroquinone reductase
MSEHGWQFANVDKYPGAEVDPLYNSQHIKDLYYKANPNYSGRYVVYPPPPAEFLDCNST